MCRRRLVVVLLGLLAGACLALTVVLSETLRPETMRLLVWQSGSFGGSGGPVAVKAGVYSYPLRLHPGARAVKLLLYHPGYAVVTAAFDAKALHATATFAPVFTPLAMLTLHGTVTDGKGAPLPGEQIVIAHVLGEMAYFGYANGMIFPATDAAFTTDAAGAFTVRLPLLSADPFYATAPNDPKKAPAPEFHIEPPADHAKRTMWPCDYTPSYFLLHSEDATGPFIIRKLYRAKLTVRIPAAARTAHAILSTDRVEVNVGASGGRSLQGMGKVGGDFTALLPPGDYMVMVDVRRNGKYITSFFITRQVTLHEREERVLTAR